MHLDRSCEQVSIMRQACSKRRTVVKGVLWTAFRQLQACLERVDFPPVLENFLLLLGEVEGATHCQSIGQTRTIAHENGYSQSCCGKVMIASYELDDTSSWDGL